MQIELGVRPKVLSDILGHRRPASTSAYVRIALARLRPLALVCRSSGCCLAGGVDVSVIRDYLGHASIATTSRYLTTNLQMKREALDLFLETLGPRAVPAGSLATQSRSARRSGRGVIIQSHRQPASRQTSLRLLSSG